MVFLLVLYSSSLLLIFCWILFYFFIFFICSGIPASPHGELGNGDRGENHSVAGIGGRDGGEGALRACPTRMTSVEEMKVEVHGGGVGEEGGRDGSERERNRKENINEVREKFKIINIDKIKFQNYP